MIKVKKGLLPLSVVSAALITAGCNVSIAPADDETGESPDNGGSPPTSQIWSDGFDASRVDLSGETITVLGPFLDAEKANLVKMLSLFEARTGASVNYVGSDQFEQDIVAQLGTSSPPDIAIFPQPGLAADMARQGKLIPVENGSEARNWIASNYAAGNSLADLATFVAQDDSSAMYGAFLRLDIKGLIWYVPDNFDKFGYQKPASMEGLKQLSDQMVADGHKPWCIGLSSGAASGWPGTDWVEAIMLKRNPVDVYDKWISNVVKFHDQRVIKAIEEFGAFAKNEQYTYTSDTDPDFSTVAETDFRDSPNPLFYETPGCFMHFQASFIPSFFPSKPDGSAPVAGVDFDFFPLPNYQSIDVGNAQLGAGTLITITQDAYKNQVLLRFLQSSEAQELWVKEGNYLTANKGVDLNFYPNPLMRSFAETLLAAETMRFDASDLMPGYIGAGAFWTEILDFAQGGDTATAAEMAEDVQTAWDAGP